MDKIELFWDQIGNNYFKALFALAFQGYVGKEYAQERKV